jgi:hypothetical protein
MTVEYVFNCPVHGNSRGVLCFRAFAKENQHLWQKYIVEYEKAEFDEGELDSFLDNCVTIKNPD